MSLDRSLRVTPRSSTARGRAQTPGEDAGPGPAHTADGRRLPLQAAETQGPRTPRTPKRSGRPSRPARGPGGGPARPLRLRARTTRVPAWWGLCPETAPATADAEPQALPGTDAAARAQTSRASRKFPSRAPPLRTRFATRCGAASAAQARPSGPHRRRHGGASVPGASPEHPEAPARSGRTRSEVRPPAHTAPAKPSRAAAGRGARPAREPQRPAAGERAETSDAGNPPCARE